jgi:tetratricopeptide (TPR) repeat protein
LQALVRELERLNVQGAAVGLEAIGTATKAMDLAKEAAVLSGEAADLLMQVRARFPTAAAYARADQAKYQLWAAPRAPEAAIEIYRQALAAWPASGSKERGEVMQAGLSIFLLAAGKEDEARQHLRKIYPQGDEKMQDMRVAAGFQELGQWFINVPPLARPPQFRQMVARWVELDPTTPVARLMAAQLALEQHNDAEAMAHIDALRTKRNRQQFAETIRFLLEHFPDSEALQFMARRMAGAEAAPVATRAGADSDE